MKKIKVKARISIQKEVEISIDDKHIKNLTNEEIKDFLIENFNPLHSKEVIKAKNKMLKKAKFRVDLDRYDIYENNKQTYGGTF